MPEHEGRPRISVCICGHDRMGYTLQDGVLTRWLMEMPEGEPQWCLHATVLLHHHSAIQEVRVHCLWNGLQYQMNYALFFLFSHRANGRDAAMLEYCGTEAWRDAIQTDIRQLPLDLKGGD